MTEVQKYANPPAAEVICEFRFPEDIPWDMTYPGILYSHLKDTYPKRDQRYVREVVILLGPEGLREELLVTERSIFLAEDEGCAVQVGPRLLSVSCQRPYVHWEAFSERISGAFDRFREVISADAIGTMNLRYVNLIEIPEQEVTLSDYFAFYPTLPPELPRVPAGFITGCEFAFHDNREHLPDEPDRPPVDPLDLAGMDVHHRHPFPPYDIAHAKPHLLTVPPPPPPPGW